MEDIRKRLILSALALKSVLRMDNQVNEQAAGGISMIESSTDLGEIPETGEVSESTSLSPLANSFEHHLGIQEDSGGQSVDVNMGIENTWTEPNCSASDVVSVAIPLPPPQPYDEFGGDAAGEITGPEHGPFLPPSSTLNNLFSDTADIPEDTVVEATSPAGVCGLRNLGNTCFMAAGLQCLTATPTVMHHFLQQQQDDEKITAPGSLMDNFSSLITKMWSGRYSVVKPTEFKQTLGAYHSQFKDYRQHDCQEFLALLLDSLHEQMNTAKSAKHNNHQPPSPSPSPSPPMLHTITTTSHQDDLMEVLDSPSSFLNSPNATMAGSPRNLDSPMDGLDSTANSPSSSPLRDDDETMDSEEIIDNKSRFIYNKTTGESIYGEIDTLNKKSNKYKFYDIIKDAKTSNANFLVTSQNYNNEIHFDSQKFPKDNSRRMALDSSNLTENHDFDNKNLSIKRINEVNVKKINGDLSDDDDDEADNQSDIDKCNVKRMRLEEQEKNYRCIGGSTSSSGDDGAIAAGEEVEADKHWARHLKTNKSIIVDTFQGQFKSTVVCAVCKYVSVTYEPFMYLSVPLPNAMERQLTVTYIPSNYEQPIRCVVSLNKQARIGKLKEELLKTLEMQDVDIANVALAEVLENHISRILDDNLLLKYIKDTSRSIYAFELTDPPDAYTSTQEAISDRTITSTSEMNNNNVITNTDEEINQCTICLEEVEGDLKRHEGNDCTFIMCQACLENYFKNQKEPRACPVCQMMVEPTSFVKIDQTDRPRPAIRILNVPLIMRYDTISNEAPNNKKKCELFSYPHLMRLPSRVSARSLYDIIERIVPEGEEYTLHFVDGMGYHCSRCMYNTHCTGCPVPESGMVSLQSSDTLAVRYTNNIPKIQQPRDHVSVSKQRPAHPLSLYDCLQAFTQSESLDEHNPWYCPKCERNQCATKTLTVHRYPKYLIVYLKRFVFYECVSMKLDDKVTFPLVGLSVGRHLYDLYACVCHFGGVSAGHYTAYAKNPHTDTWHYYNDELTSKQKPQEEDYSNAYILFYSRQGTNSKQCNI